MQRKKQSSPSVQALLVTFIYREIKNTVINKNHPYLALERNLYTKIVLLIKIHRKGKLPTHNTYTQKIDPFPNKPWFLCICSTSLLKTPLEKEKLLVTSNFSFSHSVFCPFGELSAILIKFEIFVCKLSVWKSLKFVVWERVRH